ncbi:MAG: ABC transporter permease [Ferruginibacter sp.]|nr:ABC transporter permease [Ferruginibacter sp.]
MNKIGLIISREYFTRVKKKSFFLTTILVPIVIIGFYIAIIAITVNGSSEKQSIAVIDDSNLFNGNIDSKDKAIDFKFIKNETEVSFVKKYKAQGYNAFLYVPAFDIDSPKNFTLHTQSAPSLSTNSIVEENINKAVVNRRLVSQGIDPKKYEKIASDVTLKNIDDSKRAGSTSSVMAAFIVSFACGILIYMMMIIYGTQVMRGVTEEKTNRIAEVIVSSVKPFQLMMGKIIGIGAVGLTQFMIWIILIFAGQLLLPVIFPDMLQQINGAAAGTGNASKAAEFMQGLSSLPLLKIVLSFLFYFLGGYLTYASLFAAIGSVVSEDQQEAQQLVFPILMPIVLGFVIMTKAVNDPNSSLAVFGSLFPLTSPIVMMGRITYDIPFWQLATSMLLLIGCFLLFTWMTGKIYRTGILMYGKKPSWKEMIRWGFRKQ